MASASSVSTTVVNSLSASNSFKESCSTSTRMPPSNPTCDLAPSIPDTGSSRGTDSGYASVVTSQGVTPENSSHGCTEGYSVSGSKLWHRKIIKLKDYGMMVPQSAQDRFDDLNDCSFQPLYKYIAKQRFQYRASVRLKVLGESEQNAKPWIVVQCDQGLSRAARKFFSQAEIKRELQGVNENLISFEVVICELPPRVLAALNQTNLHGLSEFASQPSFPQACNNEANHEEFHHTLLDDGTFTPNTSIPKTYIYGHSSFAPSQGLSGVSIKVIGDEEKVATIGGLVKVSYADGSFVLFGMTVSHIIPADNEGKYASGSDSNNDDEDFTGWESSDDEDGDVASDVQTCGITAYALDLCADGERPEIDNAKIINSSQTKGSWLQIGSVAAVSGGSANDKRNLDWALCIMDNDLSIYSSNISPSPWLPGVRVPRQLSSTKSSSRSEENVMVSCGTSGLKQGILSRSWAYLMLRPGECALRTYILKLSDNKELEYGDSGSWVVDNVSNEVYGHVVATDAFGEAYVVPLEDTFEQIRSQLCAQTVSLPTEDDIHAWAESYQRNTAWAGISTEPPRRKKPTLPQDIPDWHYRSRAFSTADPFFKYPSGSSHWPPDPSTRPSYNQPSTVLSSHITTPDTHIAQVKLGEGDIEPQQSRPIEGTCAVQGNSQTSVPAVPQYKIRLRQQPLAAQACGFSERERGAIDPPPILQLFIDDPQATVAELTELTGYSVVHCNLWNPTTDRDETGISVSSDGKQQRRLIGNMVSSPFVGLDDNGTECCFFCFPDLSVRTVGTYALKFSLIVLDPKKMMLGNSVPVRSTVMSESFQVYTAKDIPGIRQSTELMKRLKEQGFSTTVKRGNAMENLSCNRDKDGDEGEDENDEEESATHMSLKQRVKRPKY